MIEHSANNAIEGCSYRRAEIASVVFFNEPHISTSGGDFGEGIDLSICPKVISWTKQCDEESTR